MTFRMSRIVMNDGEVIAVRCGCIIGRHSHFSLSHMALELMNIPPKLEPFLCSVDLISARCDVLAFTRFPSFNTLSPPREPKKPSGGGQQPGNDDQPEL
jgi:hypothetical protein